MLLPEIQGNAVVALVGNSEKLLTEGAPAGKRIDDADYVIRINRGIPQVVGNPMRIGTRTSVWATAKFWPDLAVPEGTSLVVWMKLTALGKRQKPHMRARVAECDNVMFTEWSRDWERECREFVGADPSTGIRMLWWLRTKCEIQHVNVYGMDCWEAPSHWSGKKNTPNHNPELERAAMMRLL